VIGRITGRSGKLRALGLRLAERYSEYRELVRMGIAAVSAQLGDGVLNLSAIPPYVAALGLTAHVGLVYATFLIAEAAARSPMGSLGDRTGRRAVFIAAALAGSVSALLWTFARRLWVILIIQVFDGTAFAAFYTATVVGMGGAVAAEDRTAAMAAFMVTLLGGMSLGPVIGGYANDLTGSKLTSFYVASGLFLLTAVIAYYLVPARLHDTREPPEPLEQPVSLFRAMWIGLRSIPDLLVLAFIIYFPTGLILPIVKLFAMQELGMSEADYGLVFLVGAVVVAVISIASAKLARVRGRAWAIRAGLAFSAAAMFGVALIHIKWVIVPLAGAAGLGFVIALPAWLALVSDVAAPEVRGSVMGALGLGQGVGLIAGVALGGYLYNSVSIRLLGWRLIPHYSPFLVSAIAIALSFAAALAFVREDSGRYITLSQNRAS